MVEKADRREGAKEATGMFEDNKAFSGFAVDDIDAARDFYRKTLGIRVNDGEMGILELDLAGREAPVIVYPKPDHEPAGFTILNFPVDDIEATVARLRDRGVQFDRYEGTDLETDESGIFRGGGPLIAWFKDPAGNILSVIQD